MEITQKEKEFILKMIEHIACDPQDFNQFDEDLDMELEEFREVKAGLEIKLKQ